MREAMNACRCACGHGGGCTGWHAAVECGLLREARVRILDALVEGQQHIGEMCSAWTEAIKIMKCGLAVPVHGRVLRPERPLSSLCRQPYQVLEGDQGGCAQWGGDSRCERLKVRSWAYRYSSLPSVHSPVEKNPILPNIK